MHDKNSPPLKTGAEEPIEDALAHLRAEQAGAHPCDENELAIERLVDARAYLEVRTKRVADNAAVTAAPAAPVTPAAKTFSSSDKS